MPAALRLKGQAASAGLWVGPAHRVSEEAGHSDVVSLANDSESLLRAVHQSVAALRILMEKTEPEGADILEFQVEMLLDPAILEPAQQRIAEGMGAALAWAAAMDQYIAGFECADNDHVRAHAVDVVDIKNRVLDALRGFVRPDFPAGSVYIGEDMTPSQFLEHDWRQGGGVVLFGGSRASHVALLARARSVPMVVGLETQSLPAATRLLVDGTTGGVVLDPDDGDYTPFGSIVSPVASDTPSPGETRMQDGTRIELLVNISDPSEIGALDPALCDGVGLLRTEFLLHTPADLADEDRQYRIYRSVLEWAGRKPVTIRLLDIGGDKTLPGLSPDERNPSLGLRGIRLLLEKPDLLRIQARALLRAGVHGNLKILLPMVAVPKELDDTLLIFAEEAGGLARRGIAHDMPPLGIMVEVPATALMLDRFSAAAFFSIGSNDLAQYLMAAGRDNPSVSGLYVQARPVLLLLTRHIVDAAFDMGLSVGLCGDSAGDEDMLDGWLAAGLRQFSVVPSRLGRVKAFLAHHVIGQSAAMDG